MIIREHIYEKFINDSDPIFDMNIGLMHEIRKYCQDRDPNLNTLEEFLLHCVNTRKHKYVKYLLDKGANVHTGNIAFTDYNKNDDIPMRYAIFNHDLKMVKLLLKYGASIKIALDDISDIEYFIHSYNIKENVELANIIRKYFNK